MIKGLEPRLSEGGKIKIGRKGSWTKSRKGTEFQPPQKLDHFLITTTTRGEDGNFLLATEVIRALPCDEDGKIREIPIVLHGDTLDEVFPTAYACYAGRTCACRGDGEHATRWEVVDGYRTGNTKSVACPCPLLEEKRCKPHGVLHCSIAVPGLAVAGSVYKFRTTSIISVQELYGSLLHIKRTCGVFRGLPLTLCLKPVTVQPKGLKTQTVYTCYVELRAKDLVAVQRQALEMAQMREALACDTAEERANYRALLQRPADDDETEEEQADVSSRNVADESPAARTSRRKRRRQPRHRRHQWRTARRLTRSRRHRLTRTGRAGCLGWRDDMRETISAYDAGQIIESIGALFQNFERCVFAESEYVTEQANGLLDRVAAFREKIIGEYAAIEKLAAETERIGNEQYERIRDVHEKLQKRLSNLPAINVPSVYGLKELLDVAERCSRYSEEEWSRVIDLAKALGNGRK